MVLVEKFIIRHVFLEIYNREPPGNGRGLSVVLIYENVTMSPSHAPKEKLPSYLFS